MTRSFVNWYRKAQVERGDIELNDVERYVIGFLQQSIARTSQLKGVVLRIAGGWVRDKLLKRDSDDIDISVSYSADSNKSITGEQFVKLLATTTGTGLNSPIAKVEYLSADQEKSKNIAPAMVFLNLPSHLQQNGNKIVKVEFVYLRTDKYNGIDRIAETVPTNDPVEDAKRRDLTINSMFYNIGTGKIEDYVGGKKDLQSKVLRTPIEPKQTFLDDPIRMLRALRFLSKFDGFSLAPEIVQAMADPEIHQRYSILADERAGTEVRKMMQGNNPIPAVSILLNTGLYKPVFKMPDDYKGFDWDQQSPYHNMNVMNHTLKVIEGVNQMSHQIGLSGDERGLMNLCALFHDVGKLNPKYHQPRKDNRGLSYIGHEQGSANFAWEVMERMGFEKQEKKFVQTVIRWHMTPHEFDKKTMDPKRIGKFLHRTHDLYEHVMRHGWNDALAKQDIPQEQVDQINQNRQQHLDNVKQYRQEVGNLIYQPVLKGDEVAAMLPELAKQKAFLLDKGERKFYIKYALDKLLEAQWAKKVRNRDEGIAFIQQNEKQWNNLFREQQKKQQVVAGNWYRKATSIDLQQVLTQWIMELENNPHTDGAFVWMELQSRIPSYDDLQQMLPFARRNALSQLHRPTLSINTEQAISKLLTSFYEQPYASDNNLVNNSDLPQPNGDVQQSVSQVNA